MQANKEKLCEVCKTRPAMDGILCDECSRSYATRLRSAIEKTRKLTRTQPIGETLPAPQPELSGILPRAQLDQIGLRPRRTSQIVGYLLLGVGLVTLAVSVTSASTILTFIGLGLVFWGVLTLFIQPHNYVRSDLLSVTALSSLKAIGKVTIGLGYGEKGTYIPIDSPDKILVFIPSKPTSTIPQNISGETLSEKPKGIFVLPPGLALSDMIEKRLGFELRNCGLEKLIQALPKAIVEGLEIARDIETEVKGNQVNVKLIDSIYTDFCRDLKSTRNVGLGCPMCSALGCLLASATNRPVLFEEDVSTEKRTTESTYQLLTKP